MKNIFQMPNTPAPRADHFSITHLDAKFLKLGEMIFTIWKIYSNFFQNEFGKRKKIFNDKKFWHISKYKALCHFQIGIVIYKLLFWHLKMIPGARRRNFDLDLLYHSIYIRHCYNCRLLVLFRHLVFHLRPPSYAHQYIVKIHHKIFVYRNLSLLKNKRNYVEQNHIHFRTLLVQQHHLSLKDFKIMFVPIYWYN